MNRAPTALVADQPWPALVRPADVAGPVAWRRFVGHRAAFVAQGTDALGPLLERVRAATAEGLWAVGYLAYEAAPGIDPTLVTHAPAAAAPVARFDLFDAHEPYELAAGDPPALDWRPGLDRARYFDALTRIHELIAAGDTYQVNFSYPLHAAFTGEPMGLFAALAAAQRAPHGALFDYGDRAVASLSPELFFAQEGEGVLTRPMKGTAPRGRWCDEDDACAAALAACEKNRAENVMIVDLLRNDLGRVARTGSVHVPELFAVERYATVLQMTSTVAARTDRDPIDVLRALFPCGSVTGAPKVRTMQIIRELEPTPRGVYTGCCGWVGPQRRARFNVAIRTVEIDMTRGVASYGVGGGITWSSDADAEWHETRTKARMLNAARPAFELLETLRWQPGAGYGLLERHLARMAGSARYFGYPFEVGRVRAELARAVRDAATPRRVRLLLAASGTLRSEVFALEPAATEPLRIALAPEPIDARDPFLYHKTTHRAVYARARAARPEADDVILWNHRGELTEGTVSNLVLERRGRHMTPPVACGLLAGTLRAELLARGEIEERILTRADLARADRVWLINSVRGRRPAVSID